MTDLVAIRSVLEMAVVELPSAELPDLIGILAAASARAQVRLTTPVTEMVTNTAMMSAEQVAEVFGVPSSQIAEMARQHRLPSTLVGKYRRFDLAAVRAALGASSKRVSLRAPKKRSSSAASRAPATALLPPSTPEKAVRRHRGVPLVPG